VTSQAPITGEQIAELLGVSRPTIRSDLSLLVMLGYIDAKPKVGYFPAQTAVHDNIKIQKLASLKVKDVQSRAITVSETSTVGDAVVTLFLENVGSLIVADDKGSLQGVVSRKDLLKVTLGNSAAASMPIGMVMTRSNLATVDADDDIVEAARKMIYHEVDSLPVVKKHESDADKPRLEVIGRITKTSMTKLLLEFVLGH
jgi:DeoR family transcriptional regulator, catabolite repression regulator